MGHGFGWYPPIIFLFCFIFRIITIGLSGNPHDITVDLTPGDRGNDIESGCRSVGFSYIASSFIVSACKFEHA